MYKPDKFREVWHSLGDFSYGQPDNSLDELDSKIRFYIQLLAKCETEPEKQAKFIKELEDELVVLQGKKDNLDAEIDLFIENSEEYRTKINKLENERYFLKNQPLLGIIKDRLNKWLFGAK